MVSQKRAAQLGLCATCLVLIASVGILVSQNNSSEDRTPNQTAVAPADQSQSSSPIAVSPLSHGAVQP